MSFDPLSEGDFASPKLPDRIQRPVVSALGGVVCRLHDLDFVSRLGGTLSRDGTAKKKVTRAK